MRNFIRALEARGAGWLLISGQAAVLYGAATFSEDVDLWIRPTEPDLAALLLALRDAGSRIHKLTPPLEVAYLLRGHGLHFKVPDEGGGPDIFLDIMGRPPRVRDFAECYARAEKHAMRWGTVPVVSMEDLAEIKKTRRPADYDTISNLAWLRLRRALAAGASGDELRRVTRWSLENAFRADILISIFEASAAALDAATEVSRLSVRTLADAWLVRRGEPEPDVKDQLISAIAVEQGELQKADEHYWHPIIQELRELRKQGKLLPAGSPV